MAKETLEKSDDRFGYECEVKKNTKYNNRVGFSNSIFAVGETVYILSQTKHDELIEQFENKDSIAAKNFESQIQEKEESISNLNNEIASLKEELANSNSQIKEQDKEVASLKEELANSNSQIKEQDNLNKQIASFKSQIQEKDKTASELNKQIASLKEKLANSKSQIQEKDNSISKLDN